MSLNQEPLLRVGLISGASAARTLKLTLAGRYRASNGEVLERGDYIASVDGASIRLEGGSAINAAQWTLEPIDFEASRATVHGITIGVGFHWERNEPQDFQGSLVLIPQSDRLLVVNELPLEAYLVSVISSEMSASAPGELLRAHAIVSRSWLLAQTTNRSQTSNALQDESAAEVRSSQTEMIRWWDRENHADFDVCADDHCQRYQGISKAYSKSAFEAVRDTRGKVLMWGDEICDARYSKSCGGMTDEFRAAWEDRDVPYLRASYDGEGEMAGGPLPLTVESNAGEWIRSKPAAFCNTDSVELLARILPGFDQETRDFYRWEVEYSNDELSKIILDRAGLDLGRLVSLEAIERGKSSRIVRLKIAGEKETVVIGKELQIRRVLSRSHLYSSAFVVEQVSDSSSNYPKRFRLIGAGWGHGVGLCQIGAAVMAECGYSYERILSHYFRGTDERTLY
ncbi:MAG: SpoIID/LytB domain-containing protein [Acidobacteriota bacterium]